MVGLLGGIAGARYREARPLTISIDEYLDD
jgi:hypothetical protein